jgi:hypothetical protein
MVKKEDCIKIGDKYYSLFDIEEHIFKTRINEVIPSDLEE